MASVVARAMTRIDMEKASRQDVEIMKRLMLEFKDELDALGVKVDQLDKRVAKLEDGIGGWRIRGVFRFDAKFGDGENGQHYYTSNGPERKVQFEKERFRLFLTKSIDENTFFYGEFRTGANGGNNNGMGDAGTMRWSHLFVDTKLPYDIGLRVGRFTVDFEGDYGLYTDNDSIFGDFRTDGFRVSKSWGMLKATAVIGRNDNFGTRDIVLSDAGSHMGYALDLNVTPNEKFFVGATGYWFIEDALVNNNDDLDINTYGFYAGFNFTPAIALKGIYYFQDLGDDVAGVNGGAGVEDSPKAWKAILDIKQEALKFTSLWVEYSQQDNTFLGYDNRYAIGGGAYDHIGRNFQDADGSGTTKFIFATARQQWNDKWSTFLRYAQADFDTAWLDDATEWGIGVGYQYTPAIYFELMYDQVDHGDSWANRAEAYDKESVFRFRTNVSF